mgnify:CR=1 FL=1
MLVPDRKLVIIAYDLYRNYPGMSIRDIAAIIGVSSATVGRWLKNEHRYHPDLDQIAIARALGGEKAVFDNLTIFEYWEMVNRIIRIRTTMDDVEWAEWLNELTDRLVPGDVAGRERLAKRFSQAVRRGTP